MLLDNIHFALYVAITVLVLAMIGMRITGQVVYVWMGWLLFSLIAADFLLVLYVWWHRRRV